MIRFYLFKIMNYFINQHKLSILNALRTTIHIYMCVCAYILLIQRIEKIPLY